MYIHTVFHIHTKRTYFRTLMRDGTCSIIMVISCYFCNVNQFVLYTKAEYKCCVFSC